MNQGIKKNRHKIATPRVERGEIKIIVNFLRSTTTYYINDDYEIIGGVATKYIFAGNLRVAQISGTTVSYFHKDHLGSSTVTTNASGAVIESANYEPFGNMRAHAGTTTSSYKFTDQELDGGNGLYNYDARLYDPIIGRFISADTVVPKWRNPQTLNRYSYCQNNPLIYTDPSGHELLFASWLTDILRQQIFQYIQQLTADKLAIKDNKIIITSLAGTKDYLKKKGGTDIFRGIIYSGNTATADMAQPDAISSEHRPQDEYRSGTDGNGRNSNVYLNFNDHSTVETIDPNTGKIVQKEIPNVIKTAHEFDHSFRAMYGNAIDLNKKGDIKYQDENGQTHTVTWYQEEFATVGLGYNKPGDITENQLRVEQGIDKTVGLREAY
jgi:RHS repeat-associated protein